MQTRWLALHRLPAGRCLVLAHLSCGAAALEVQVVLAAGRVESVWTRRVSALPRAHTNSRRGRVAGWHLTSNGRKRRRFSAPANG